MSSPRITFTYSSRSAADPWWVRLEQEDLPDDTATLNDAADLLDTLYNLDACSEDENIAEVTDPSTANVEETVDITVDRVACSFDADGNVDVDIRVIRSRQDAPYKLALSGGTLLTTETITEPYSHTILVENASKLTLDYPVIDGFTAAWGGAVYGEQGSIDSPEIKLTGNTLDFDGVDVASGSLTVSYLTEYDRCTVTVNGIDGEPGACTARVFFHGLVDELEIEIPEASEPLASCTTRWAVATLEYDIECYKMVTVSTRCQCSDRKTSSYTYEESVDCPESVVRCQGVATECRHLVGSVTVPEYVECSDDNEVTGRPGMIHPLSTPKYYEEHCCKTPSFTLPDCPEKKISHRGGMPLAGGAAQYYNIYGPKLRIIPVSPPGGICGDWTIRQVVNASGCCDGVTPIVLVDAPSTMDPGSDAVIRISGGRPPYVWRITGVGMTFYRGGYKEETIGGEVRIHAASFACGYAGVTVTDGCSELSAGTRITVGAWEEVGQYFSSDDSQPLSAATVLAGYCGTILTDGPYLGFTRDGTVSQLSDDNRYWMGGGTALPEDNPMVPGRIGVPFQYLGSYNTKGVPLGQGCLDGYAPADPLVGVFHPVLALFCAESSGGTYSRTPSSSIFIYQWGC